MVCLWLQDDGADLFHIGESEIGIHREAENAVCRVEGYRCECGIKAGKAGIAIKGGGERIEVLAGNDVFGCEQIKDFITGMAVAIEDNGIIGEIRSNTRLWGTEVNTGNSLQECGIVLENRFPLFNLTIQMA